MLTKEMPCVSKYNLKTDKNYKKWVLTGNNMIPHFIPELTNPTIPGRQVLGGLLPTCKEFATHLI